MTWKHRDGEENKINRIINEEEEEEEEKKQTKKTKKNNTSEGRSNGKKEHWCNIKRDMKIAY